MLTDTHSHLDFPDFSPDLDAVLDRAREAGVPRIITIATDLASSRQAVELAERHPGVYATIGIHPNDAQEAPENFIEELRPLASHPKVVAIGECGLDYHRLPGRVHKSPFEDVARADVMQDPMALSLQIADDAVKNRQAAVFQQQLDLAVETGLNVVIHQRDSWTDLLALLDPYHGRLRTVFHCFGGNSEDAAFLFSKGHLISFTGIVTFKNARTVQETARTAPSGSFMVETDCPFLAPTPHRGQRCEPAHTRLVAEKIAELRGQSLAEVANATETAAHSFFRFPH
jgi:TatD DNase family protein